MPRNAFTQNTVSATPPGVQVNPLRVRTATELGARSRRPSQQGSSAGGGGGNANVTNLAQDLAALQLQYPNALYQANLGNTLPN